VGKLNFYQIINKPDQLKKYENFDVFYKTKQGYCLYKKHDQSFTEARLQLGLHPDELFITFNDRVSIIRNKQHKLNNDIKKSIKVDVDKARESISELITVTLSEPRSEILKEIKNTINIIVKEFLEDPEVVIQLTKVSLHDYSTTLHLTNCMLFCIGYGYYSDFNEFDIKTLGLMGLLHDVGKIEIPDYILQSDRRLSDEEFEIIKQHPIKSKSILSNSNFDKKVILSAYEHHERLDGSGYPKGKKSNEINEWSKIMSIIDIFEALTNWRPYKQAMPTLEALKILKKEVTDSKIDKTYFEKFARSLIGMKKV